MEEKPRGGRGGRRPGAGRKAGSAHLKDAEVALVRRYEREAEAVAKSTGARRRLLCKEIMADLANRFFDLAEKHDPFDENGKLREGGDFHKYVQLAVLAAEAASKGAPYESPRYQATVVPIDPPGSRNSQLGELPARERLMKLFADMEQRLRPALPAPQQRG